MPTITEISNNLSLLAKKLYKNRDKSHGIMHVYKVRDNALDICNKLNITDLNIIIKIVAVALFHELWDQKYVSILSGEYIEIIKIFRSELKKLYFSEHEIKDIEIIINNISLTREMELKKINQSINLKHLQLIRDIVSDADKLEMVGFSGMERIIEFQIYKYPETKSYELKLIVKDVYKNKISKLLDENYIKTEPGRHMARPLMQEMKNYVDRIN